MILRSIVTLEQEGADVFFGEPEFDVDDLLRTTPDGRGVVTLLEVADVMDRPRLYSTFVLWMLAQLYEQLPEMGDLPKPKLAFFFDEAHLLFKDASEALMDQIERTARLIRSKGVGVYFVTQAPTDVPSSVLSQLGNRVQHALRAFTPEDADALRKTARTFPMTDHYDVERTITEPGHRRGVRHGAQRPRASRRRSPPRASSRRTRAWRRSRPRRSPRSSPPRRSPPATTRRSTARAPTRSSPGRLTNAKAAAATAAAEAQLRDQVSPTTADGLGHDDPGPAAARDQAPRARARGRPQGRGARAQGPREGGGRRSSASASGRCARRSTRSARSIGSRATQSLLRGVFDTIFGGGKR